MPMSTDGKNTGFTLSGDIPLANGDLLRVGGEYQRYRLDDWWSPSGAGMWPHTFWNINDGQRDRYALFGEWETRKELENHIKSDQYRIVLSLLDMSEKPPEFKLSTISKTEGLEALEAVREAR